MASTSTPLIAVEFERTPAWLVWVAAAGVAVSAALLVPVSLATSVAGYVLAPLVVTFLVSVYRYRDAVASRSPMHSANPNLKKIGTALVVASFIVGVAHAWIIATYIARNFGS